MKPLLLFILILFSVSVSIAQIQIGFDIDGEAADDYSGGNVSVSTDGSRVAIGAPFNTGNGPKSGHTRIYEDVNGIWVQIGQDIDAEAADDNFGASVSISAFLSIPLLKIN